MKIRRTVLTVAAVLALTVAPSTAFAGGSDYDRDRDSQCHEYQRDGYSHYPRYAPPCHPKDDHRPDRDRPEQTRPSYPTTQTTQTTTRAPSRVLSTQ